VREIRIHGRGGQGSVLAAELIAVAAFEEGRFGQAFPVFGGERRGAPVQAFVRIADEPIRLRTRVQHPDYVIVQDLSLMATVDVCEGLRASGLLLANAEGALDVAWPDGFRVCSVPALRIALQVFGRPFLNPSMLGAFAAASGEIRLESIQSAFRSRFPGDLGDKNALAAQLAYEMVKGDA
jgi:pyruvate ferredoxin oxidoreductase gamma subunit